MLNALSKLFDTNAREISKYQKIVDQINSLEPEFQKLKDKDFKAKTAEFKMRISRGETLDDILPEAFATVREASRRTLGLRHYDVQLIAGMAFHHGKVAEQKTGEGKTLSATLSLYLNALTERGVHLVTVNDYLAQRDAGWNGPLFEFLDISVGVIVHDSAFVIDSSYESPDRGDERLERLKPVARKEAYAADITYGTSNEFGFDYLRDNMAQSLQNTVQRGHYYAIVDEVDSILVDEARTPLIISAPDTEPTDKYVKFKQIVDQLNPDSDFEVDEKFRTAVLTDYGVKRIEKMIGVDNLYEKDFETLHHIEQALKAKSLFHRDKEYVVRDNEVVIVDEHTGRLMFGRRYSDGLHQAIEAKEGVAIQRESKTLATISLQNYFRMYEKLGGMTGTAETEAEEFRKIYNMDVLVVPTNRPVQRQDHPDQVYKTTRAKYGAIVKEVQEKHKTGQPVLLGTRSIEQNEVISNFLKRKKIKHEVLNAKNHEREAQIIADAGKPFAVTVATNMAGRGVDIVLGGSPPENKEDKKAWQKWREDHQKVLDLGGLHVIGSERHESRRIDNQLRGRSGRQGDPGSSRFYVSLEDEIMRIFGGEQISKMMTALKIPEDQPIEAGLVSRSIANAQSKVESFHFDQRKRVVEYDDVLNKQREIIYKKRRTILEEDPATDFEKIHNRMLKILDKEIELLTLSRAEGGFSDIESNTIVKEFVTIVPLDDSSQERLHKALEKEQDSDKMVDRLLKIAHDAHTQRIKEIGDQQFAGIEQFVLLRTIDELWINHLDNVDELRQGISLRGSQETAISEYKREAFDLFETLINTINAQSIRKLFRVQVMQQQPAPVVDLDKVELEREEPEEPVITDSPAVADNPFAAALAKTANTTVKPQNTGIKTEKIGRNDPCPCGSGKKWKKCGMINAPYHRA